MERTYFAVIMSDGMLVAIHWVDGCGTLTLNTNELPYEARLVRIRDLEHLVEQMYD